MLGLINAIDSLLAFVINLTYICVHRIRRHTCIIVLGTKKNCDWDRFKLDLSPLPNGSHDKWLTNFVILVKL